MAILKDTMLLDYQIKLFKEVWSNDKLLRILTCIDNYVIENDVSGVAFLVPSKHYITPEIRQLAQKLAQNCKRRHIRFCSFNLKDLQNLYGETRAKKKALMQALSLQYPELTAAQKKELTNKKKYYIKLFEAVGAATLHCLGATKKLHTIK